MPFDDWVADATPADLLSLADAVAGGRVPLSAPAGTVQLAGFDGRAAAFLEGLGAKEPRVVEWALRRLADERRRADDRHANVARLVWSGAVQGAAGFRDTRAVLESLFGRAERHVLLSTFVIYAGRSVFAPLFQRLMQRPEIEVEMYVNLPSKSGSAEDEGRDVGDYLDLFRREHWVEDVPLPSLYFDPESRRLGATRTSLHAKCVVVDDRWAFVTSANFTEAAQERNIEVGVLLEHPRLAAALVGRFHALRDAGRLRRMRRG